MLAVGDLPAPPIMDVRRRVLDPKLLDSNQRPVLTNGRFLEKIQPPQPGPKPSPIREENPFEDPLASFPFLEVLQ